MSRPLGQPRTAQSLRPCLCLRLRSLRLVLLVLLVLPLVRIYLRGVLFSLHDSTGTVGLFSRFYFRQIALGLAAMHAQHIAHRDIKLENVMVRTLPATRSPSTNLCPSLLSRCLPLLLSDRSRAAPAPG